ncbi:MAG: ATP-binding protein [Methanomicrobia archaeon]|nr:ATP-binding protein [Methanomicrobia archaeon]
MRRTEFHNREREKKEIMNILNTEPTLITFIYGPINSGKTELITHLIKQLSEEYAVFYINLRGKFIKSYEEFLDVLFEIDEEKKVENVKEYAKAVLKDFKSISGIPIPINLFDKMFERRERSKDVFKYIEGFLVEIAKKCVPVLIIDELHVIGDVKIDELLIYKLFNFFIRLTKELHLAHVFAVTSDSLFIERIYSEAMLQGRCRYLLVDDFDKETAMNFFDKYGFNDREKENAWIYCGGKPVYLLELMRAEDKEEMVKKMLKIRTSQIEELLNSLRAYGDKIEFRGGLHEVSFDKVVEGLSKLKEKVYVYEYITPEISYLVRNNIIFVDPLEKVMRAQSTLDLLAIREVVKDA